jgi:biotin carboxyl carrier protein
MTFCNELASRYRCDRVSLGWLKGAYVRLQAISHMERFEKKMDAVQTLEAAMEEAFDQDEEILWPATEGSLFVTRDHETFSREQGSKHILSLPIRLEDEPVGVVTCERSKEPFSEEEIRGLRVLCDQAARRLGDLKRHDRWFGARMAQSVKESLGKLLGVEHTFAKLIGLVVCAALAFLIFGKLNYRVEAPFILKTDDLAYLPAPFDGYIDEVHVKVGDLVKEKDPLLTLDTRELLLEESTAIANQNRYSREAEKARAQNALADMRIAMALEAQAVARLKLVRYHLNHAQLRAPFVGIVVEGDLEELLGAPVKKGDILFKVARIEKMYAEVKVDERDIHEVTGSATGQIAFVSRPDLKFPIHVARVDPVAIPEEEGNVFLVRAHLTEEFANWWRPGMSGVAKINVGKRNVLWILTHRTIDFLRIFFWW